MARALVRDMRTEISAARSKATGTFSPRSHCNAGSGISPTFGSSRDRHNVRSAARKSCAKRRSSQRLAVSH